MKNDWHVSVGQTATIQEPSLIWGIEEYVKSKYVMTKLDTPKHLKKGSTLQVTRNKIHIDDVAFYGVADLERTVIRAHLRPTGKSGKKTLTEQSLPSRAWGVVVGSVFRTQFDCELFSVLSEDGGPTTQHIITPIKVKADALLAVTPSTVFANSVAIYSHASAPTALREACFRYIDEIVAPPSIVMKRANAEWNF